MAEEITKETIQPISWPRVLGLSLLFSALGAIWITATEIVFRSAQVGEAVPPVPAVATLVFLLAMRRPMTRLSRKWSIPDREILAIYGFTTIAMTVGFVNGFRNIAEMITMPLYGEKNEATLELVRRHWPAWIAPTDPKVIQWMWQGSPDDRVPWAHWIRPLLCIGGILTLTHVMCGSLFGLLQRRWLRDELLAYPVAELAISLVEKREEEPGVASHLLTSLPFRWGLAGALVFNLVWILPALRPATTVPPQYTDLNLFLPEGPWRAGYIWFIRYNLAALGLAILVPTDVLFTVWFSTLLLKGEAVVLALLEHDRDTCFNLAVRQGLGGYVAMAIMLLWSARRSISILRRCDSGHNEGYGWSDGVWLALFGLSATLLLAVFIACGMTAWLAVAALCLLIVRLLVVSRIRAQVGVPIVYFHVGDIRSLIFVVGGSAIAATGQKSVTAFVIFSLLTISAYLAPYQADGYRLAAASKLGGHRWMILSVIAVIVGFFFAAFCQLTADYRFGSEMLGWTSSTWPIAQYTSGLLPNSLEPARWPSVVVGFGTTSLLILLQHLFTWWPLQPIGFVVACAIGGYVFGPALVAWIVKVLALRYRGMPGYLATKDFFLGLVIGHFGVATVWGLMGALNFEPTKRYIIGFW